jgi:hypothetical protein
MLGIEVLICFPSFMPVKPPKRTFWYERLKIGVLSGAKKRLLTLWTAHDLGQAKQAVRWRYPPGMGDIRALYADPTGLRADDPVASTP